ncbi:MAG: hypothetical protein KBT88_13200 [Gammaproteobacteria bacterium]|nr:hypothetical protein [Gammaproteobacteria bacterium]MBQ0840734.1 hypothetical protein [Gammaproteobacteria bacterium]
MLLSLLLVACNAPIQVKSTTYTHLQLENSEIVEAQLLDLGVLAFDPGLDELSDKQAEIVLPAVRVAEGHYLANQLARTIQDSSSWGAVRVLPTKEIITDVYVEGTIVHSDGEKLELNIVVSDTSGQQWYQRRYQQEASKYAYERRKTLHRDPFQGLFNRIANDLAEYRKSLSGKQATTLRNISSLRFARDFSPEAFSQHIQADRKGVLEIKRLPASNDPTLQRVQRIRERDYLFVDTTQEYYDAFSLQMAAPYQSWRAQNYDEVLATRRLQRQSRERTIGGIVTVIAGIVAAGSSSGASRAAGAVAIGSGAMLVKSGLAKKGEAQIHIEALAELGESLQTAVEPRTVTLEDQTITLSGNVEAQYTQWKALLQKMYAIERGSPATLTNAKQTL